MSSDNINIQIDFHPFYNDLFDNLSEKGHNISFNICDNKISLNTQGNLISYIKKYGSLDYNKVLNLSLFLTLHISILRNFNYGFLYFDPKDIYIIDDTFIISNLHHCFPLINNKLIINDYPHTYVQNYKFIAPELNNPCFIENIYYNIIFYSLALICIYCLNIQHINDIYHSKLFFALKRCLRDDITKRIFYYL